MATKAQLAQYCADHFPHHIPHFSGVSYMTALVAGVVSLVAGFGLGWYVKGRGVTGVKTDASNAVQTVKTDVAAIETAVAPVAN